MPSPRRVRLLLLVGVGMALLILVYLPRLGNESPEDFYDRTVHAIDTQKSSGAGAAGAQQGSKPLQPADRDKDGDIDAEDEILGAEMQERLKDAELRAKAKANERAPLPPDHPSDVIGVGSSADGQDASSDGADAQVVEEERDTEAELNSILKKSPTIIFSKTYCPYSKHAKQILLDKYSITPEPYVVELDEHELGSNLQDSLKERTGRRTVPNILINGVSIGGADEVTALDEAGELMSKVLELGSKRIEMVKRPASRGSRS